MRDADRTANSLMLQQVAVDLSRHMGKPTICEGENKGADQFRSNCEADQLLCFATRIVQFLYFTNPKLQASSLLLCL